MSLAGEDLYGDDELTRLLGESEREDEREGATGHVGNSIVNELVKSYGFKRTDEGDWSWDLETIGKSFKESPFWTTIDWLAVAAPVLKWGTAVNAVSKGVGVYGKALKGGDLAGKAATGVGGRVANVLVGGERAYAAQQFGRGPSRFAGGRFANPITTQVSDEFLELGRADRYGMEAWEQRGVAKAIGRERALEQGLRQREAGDIIRQWDRSGVSKAQMIRATRFLEGGVSPMDELVTRSLGERGAAAYKNTWDFRNTIHDEAFDVGLISRETYERNLKTYSPRVYEEWEKVSDGIREMRKAFPGAEVGRRVAKGATDIGDTARFQQRKADKAIESLNQILDPRVAVDQLGRAGQVIAKQRYAQNIARSVIAKDAIDVARVAESIVNAPNVAAAAKLAKIHGLSSRQVEVVRGYAKHLNSVGAEKVAEEMALEMGWKRMDTLLKQSKLPEGAQQIPEELMGKWIDPAAAKDVMGSLEFLSDSGQFTRIYNRVLSTFRASKTAYNPATHMRNTVGAAVFHHLVTGGLPRMVPRKGIKALSNTSDEQYKAARAAGIVGSAFDAEIREALEGGYRSVLNDPKLGQATAMDWMGDSAIARWTQKGAGKAERFYRGIDEAYKVDAWITKTEQLQKAGHSLEEARKLATLEVNKFMPSFTSHSEFTDLFRAGIPFASFTTEALRVWKNALVEKPHLAYFWNHTIETMSQTFGAMAGFSPEQLADAEAALPHYMKNKKALMLPFNVDGQPRFVDFSYLIPLANIVEVEQAGDTFLAGSPIDPTSNPFLNLATAAATNVDPFSGRELQPQFTERQLGVPVTGQRARTLVGLGEHMARMMLPPIVPPGYAGVNLLEMARGQKHPKTQENLEDGVLRTILANLGGVRMYAPDVESQVLNMKHAQRERQGRMTQAWRRWEHARANGNVTSMAEERDRILAIREAGGFDDAEDYFGKSVKRRQPFASLSTRQLEEAIKKAEALGELSPRDERLRAELMARYQARGNRKRKGAKK